MTERADVIIMGGGLAGLALALQLRLRFPDLEVRVLERRRHPVPAAAHKVGESTVEIGAHYFDTVLGLAEHLSTGQLDKFGFRFFFSDGRSDLDRVTEVGNSRYLAVPTYQLDRGRFENFLGERARACGARFLDGAVVRGFELAEHASEHQVFYEHGGKEQCVAARWLIDASGRAGLIKRRLGLAEANEHDANAVWFRIGERIDIDDWSNDRDWLARCEPRRRWLSTTHLVGEGYWVWLIPLASGSHSVGIVADARLHPLAGMNTFERALGWLRRHQPRLAHELEIRRDRLQDFLFLRGFSYGCKQVFSGSCWALTGEAGVFIDPLYSPGSDFIAISNTYITELVALDRSAQPLAPYARLFEQFYFSFYRSTLSLYAHQYPIFGDPEVMPVKIIWDYAYYWGMLCQLFFQRRLADVSMMASVRPELTATYELNQAMQRLLREWSRVSRKRNPAAYHDQIGLDWYVELNRGLRDELDDAEFKARMRVNSVQLHGLAATIVAHAAKDRPDLDFAPIRMLIDRFAANAGGLPHVPPLVEAQRPLALAS
jgi:flavin-dependent dehydrogenase